MDSPNAGFLEIIELHERMWGTEQYPQRPKLSDLLTSPIVALWIELPRPGLPLSPFGSARRPTLTGSDEGKDRIFKLACYTTPEELNEALMETLLASSVSPRLYRKLSRLFFKQKPVTIKGVRLIVESGSES